MLKKSVINLLVITTVTLLAACSHSSYSPAPYASKSNTITLRGAAMADTCVEHAAERYNLQTQRIRLAGVESFQGSYEMRGYTPREETFTCSFDGQGEFLHLSMR